MKTINNFIAEKLRLNKTSKYTGYVAGGEYTFDEFKELILTELQATDDDWNSIIKYMRKSLFKNDELTLKNISFIDISNDKKEINFFKIKIIIPINKDISSFKSAFCIKTEEKLPVFHYFNCDDKRDNDKWQSQYQYQYQYRIGYNTNNDIFDISTMRLFKINI